MTRSRLTQEALKLPTEDRLALAETLIESVEGEQEVLPAWQRELLDERLEDARRAPDGWLAWEQVKADIEQELTQRRRP